MAFVEKPRLRGLFHLWAFFVAIVAGVMLIAFADGALPRFAAWVYAMALAAMFGASALYHRVWWSDRMRPWMRRLDHAGMTNMQTASAFIVVGKRCIIVGTKQIAPGPKFGQKLLKIDAEAKCLSHPMQVCAINQEQHFAVRHQ